MVGDVIILGTADSLDAEVGIIRNSAKSLMNLFNTHFSSFLEYKVSRDNKTDKKIELMQVTNPGSWKLWFKT